MVRDALARELPQAGAQVIVLPSSISPEQLARAAADEDADTVIVATYNGGALTLGKELMRTLPADVTVIFGGVLNEDDGGPLPVDARPGLEALGIRCVDEIERSARRSPRIVAMRYLALIYGNKEIWNNWPDRPAVIAEVDAFNQRLTESGELITANGLIGPPINVRQSGDSPVVSDGPYLEVKEHVGSYFILDVESYERALEIVQEYPGVTSGGGGVELWRLMHQR